MRIRLSVVLGFFAINIFLALWLPWREELLLPTCGGLAAGVAIYVVGRAVRRALSRRRGSAGPAGLRLTTHDVRLRTSVVAVLFAAVTTGLTFGLPLLVRSGIAVEVLYYLSLMMLGAALAGWAGASEEAAFTVVVGMTLGLVGIQLAMFVADPARFRFGPEIWLFAAGQYAGRFVLLPVDLGVALAVWHVAQPYDRSPIAKARLKPRPTATRDS